MQRSPITVEYVWTEDEFRRLLEAYQPIYSAKSKVRLSFLWGLLVYLALVGLSILFVCAWGDGLKRGVVIGTLGVSGGLALLMWYSLLREKRVLLDSLTGDPDLGHPVRCQVTEDRWTIESASGRGETTWRRVLKVIRVADGFAVVHHGTPVRWLPIHGFVEEGAVEEFVRLAQELEVPIEDRTQGA